MLFVYIITRQMEYDKNGITFDIIEKYNQSITRIETIVHANSNNEIIRSLFAINLQQQSIKMLVHVYFNPHINIYCHNINLVLSLLSIIEVFTCNTHYRIITSPICIANISLLNIHINIYTNQMKSIKFISSIVINNH